jgi:DNA-binding GntR family transcriptional regulator
MAAETPAYRRIADDLRRQIAEGRLTPGDKIPSRYELAEAYEVSPPVAVRAVRILTAEGLLIGRSGSGTYVRARPQLAQLLRHPRAERPGSPWRATAADVGAAGTWTSSSEATDAPDDIAERLDIEPAARCMRTRYVFRVDDQPAMLSTSWEPMEITAGQPILMPEAGPLAGLGVVARFAAIGVTIVEAEEEISARPASADEAVQLGEPAGTLLQTVQRTYRDDTGRPVETADILIPVARYSLVYRLPVE